MGSSFFENKIQEHKAAWPELMKTEWLSYQDLATKLHHLEPGKCGYYSKDKGLTTLLANSIVTAGDILKNRNICKKCRSYGLSEEGFIGNMLGHQITLLEINDLPKLVESYWQGRSRTITDDIHGKFWKNTLKSRLENNSKNYNNTYAVTYGSLHYAKIDRSSHYKNIISNITNGFIYKSDKGGIWLYSVEKPVKNEYEVLLEENKNAKDDSFGESLRNLGGFCDNALQHGGWDDITYWWEISKKL